MYCKGCTEYHWFKSSTEYHMKPWLKIRCFSARNVLQACDDLSVPTIFSESQHFIENHAERDTMNRRFVLENKNRETFISKSRCGCKLKKGFATIQKTSQLHSSSLAPGSPNTTFGPNWRFWAMVPYGLWLYARHHQKIDCRSCWRKSRVWTLSLKRAGSPISRR